MTGEGGGVLEELLRGSLDHCVKCTICETACPVSNVTPIFAGPKYTGPQAERYRVPDEPSVEMSVDYCSGCGICTQVCPQGVRIAEINAQARNKLKRQKGVPLRGLPDPGEPRFVGDYLAEQPMARVGVAVDGSLRAEGTENVLVAGAEPWREKSGDGLALASGYRAAQAVLEELT